MGLRRRLSKKWNETVNGVLSGPGVDVDSVNTGALTDGQDGQAWETLRELGFNDGDYVTVATFEPFKKITYSTSSQSYSGSSGFCNISVDWGSLAPANVDSVSVLMTAYLPETADMRLYNATANETLAEATDVSSEATTSFEEYTIPDKTSTDFLRAQIRSPDGSSVELDTPQVVIGLEFSE